MWSLLKSSGWWLNSDSFVFPISGNYTCWKELIHFGKTVFSNLWSTETFFPFFVCKQIVGLLQGRRPRQHLGRPFRMAFFSQVKLGQGENSEQFEAGEKKKIQKCNIKLWAAGDIHLFVCPGEGRWFVTWISGLPVLCSCLLSHCGWPGRVP